MDGPLMRSVKSLVQGAVKGLVLRFAGRAASWWSAGLGRTTRDYAASVGDGRGNAIVVAVIAWLARTFPEAPVRVSTIGPDGPVPTPTHPLALLLAQPNPHYSGHLLWMATLADWMTSGNAYWLKARSAAGRVVELWWVPASIIEPRWPDDGSLFLSHYEYRPNAQAIRVEPEDVVHFRYGLDPTNLRKGLSPIAALVREIYTDDEAANFSASLLSNLGVPGVIIAPAENVTVSQEDVEQIKGQFEQRFAGDNRGRAMVMSARTSATVLSFNPQQMDLRTLRRLPEERVTAVFGVPAIVVGLGAGLDRSTFANYAEAREAAYESNVIPTQRLLAAELATQLAPDFGDRLLIDFDLSQVRVLQADQNDLHARVRDDVRAGVLTVNEGRQHLGLEPLPGADVLYLPVSVTPTDPAELLVTVPAPAAVSPAGGKVLVLPPPPTRHKAADGERLVTSLAGVRTRLSARLEPALARFLTRQATRVVGRLGGTSKAIADLPSADDLLPEDEAEQLRALLQPWHLRALEATVGLVQGALDVSFELDDVATRQFMLDAGANIPGITTTTRDAIRTALADGIAAGDDLTELAARIRDLPAFNLARAQVVARTELGYATNHATMASYEASGVVAGVRVHDGDYDSECQAANGRTLSLSEARTFPRLAHPNCLVGESLVIAPNVNAAFARWFDGEVIVLRTAANDLLTCTPNHPILTPLGWVAAGDLLKGSYVIRSLDAQGIARVLDPNNDYRPTSIQQVADTFGPTSGGTATTMPSAAEAFHGDGSGSDVYVVRTDSLSEHYRQAANLKPLSEQHVIGANPMLASFTSEGASALLPEGLHPATRGFVGGCGPGPALFGGKPAIAEELGLMSRSRQSGLAKPTANLRSSRAELGRDLFRTQAFANVQVTECVEAGMFAPPSRRLNSQIAVMELPTKRGRTDADGGRDLVNGLAGLVAPVKIIKVERRQFAGHVYNLETQQGWYIAENIITHNCRRAFAPITDAAELAVAA